MHRDPCTSVLCVISNVLSVDSLLIGSVSIVLHYPVESVPLLKSFPGVRLWVDFPYPSFHDPVSLSNVYFRGMTLVCSISSSFFFRRHYEPGISRPVSSKSLLRPFNISPVLCLPEHSVLFSNPVTGLLSFFHSHREKKREKKTNKEKKKYSYPKFSSTLKSW